MSELEDTKISIFNKFITIEFDKEDANRRKMQAIADYLEDVKDNAKEYNSALYVQGIFSFEDEAPIENWLVNNVKLNYQQIGWTSHTLFMQKNGLYFILYPWRE